MINQEEILTCHHTDIYVDYDSEKRGTIFNLLVRGKIETKCSLLISIRINYE